MSTMKPGEVKILAVEDDPGDFGLIQAYLRQAGYSLEIREGISNWAKTLAEAELLAKKRVPDLVLLDLNLPDSAGLDTLIRMQQILPGVPVLVLSGNMDMEVAVAAVQQGAQDYLVKGHYEHDAIGKAIRHALIRAGLETRLRLFEVALNSVVNSIVITDRDAHIEWVNPAFTSLTGYTLEEALGHKPGELVKSGKQDQAFYHRLWQTILSGTSWQGEIVNRRKNGELYHEELIISPVFDQLGTLAHFVAVKQDISGRIALNAERERLLRILEDATDYIGVSDMQGHLQFHNVAARRMVGLPDDEDMSGMVIRDMHPECGGKLVMEVAIPALLQYGFWQGENALLHRDGHEIPVSQSLRLHRDASGNPQFISTIMRDITQSKATEERMRHLAHFDPLTDLPNRSLFSDRLQQNIIAAKRDKTRFALLFVDLDKFKPVNDEFGHHVGDQLLQEVAVRMQDCVRESDTVARLGGDEFVILLATVETEKDALGVAEKIRKVLERPFELIGRQLFISSSIGVVMYPEHGTSPNRLVKNADTAMYYAKEAGRNSVRLYHHEMVEQ